MLFCRLLIFSKSTFSKNSFRNTIRVSNSLDPDQARHYVGPDLDPNCLQRLSADDTSTLRDIFGILKIKDGSIKAVYFIFISRMVVFILNINSGSAD